MLFILLTRNKKVIFNSIWNAEKTSPPLRKVNIVLMHFWSKEERMYKFLLIFLPVQKLPLFSRVVFSNLFRKNIDDTLYSFGGNKLKSSRCE